MTDTFHTHTGELVTGQRLAAGLALVASDWADMARAIRQEDAYASHVTEADKDSYLADDLALAERIRNGEVKSFTIWQRVNAALTGECVALLG